MKRISILAIAVALVTTLTQCKKTENPTNDNEGGKVHITLDVNSNSRVIISPETGGTAFEQGDKVLVANGGHYVGTLTYDQSQRKFDGDLNEGLSTTDYLHFYLLGNKDTEENLNDDQNRPTALTVNISDQTASYPEIAYAHSTMKYTNGVTAYTARLLNKCALVKFTTDNIPTSVAVNITGMNNQVSVNLVNNSFTYSKVGDGIISLHAESKTARWGILLPQGEVDDVVASAEGYVTTPAFTVPQHGENDYLNEGIDLELVESYPVGAINGRFTINNSGGQVYFSKGNLQYQASTSTWRFAEHQNDYVGDATNGNVYVNEVKCNNANISSDYSGWIDLFGWGTSGYNHGATCYQPYSTSTNRDEYNPYGSMSYNLYDQTGKADWGYNAILNGGNTVNISWRTLTKDECGYVFTGRANAASKYGHGSVNGVNGMILLPDEWSLPAGLSFTPGNSNWANHYTTEEWAQMEANGAVFLPAAGFRQSGNGGLQYMNGMLLYWSSSFNSVNAYYMRIGSNSISPQYDNGGRYCGLSVRLVRNVHNR